MKITCHSPVLLLDFENLCHALLHMFHGKGGKAPTGDDGLHVSSKFWMQVELGLLEL